MTEIRRIEILGYRGIENLTIEPKGLNILVGRNNTGKSSILEAVALAATSRKGFFDALGQDVLEELADARNWHLKYFLKLGRSDSQIKSAIEGQRTAINLEYAEKGLPPAGRDYFGILERYARERRPADRRFRVIRSRINPPEDSEIDASHRMDTNLREISSQPKLYVSTDTPSHSAILFEDDQEVRKIDTEGESDVLFLNIMTEDLLSDLYDKLVPTSRFPHLIDSMKNSIPYLTDIRTLKDEVYIYQKNVPGPVPLRLMGDGFSSLLTTAFMSAIAPRGIFIVEEPENSLHPGFINLVAEYIANAVKDFGIQVFVSTHSMEFLRAILPLAKDQARVFRLYHEKDTVTHEIIEGNKAVESAEIGEDLRGI